MTGRVGVCEGPSGGGATYILPGVVEANESSIPVLALTTDIGVSSRGRYVLTELEQRALEADHPTLIDITCQPLHEANAPVSEWIA